MGIADGATRALAGVYGGGGQDGRGELEAGPSGNGGGVQPKAGQVRPLEDSRDSIQAAHDPAGRRVTGPVTGAVAGVLGSLAGWHRADLGVQVGQASKAGAKSTPGRRTASIRSLQGLASRLLRGGGWTTISRAARAPANVLESLVGRRWRQTL